MTITPEVQAPSPSTLTPRARVLATLGHTTPDRVPTDLRRRQEINGHAIEAALGVDAAAGPQTEYLSAEREAVLAALAIDCRLVSYDMFCCPPGCFVATSASAPPILGKQKPGCHRPDWPWLVGAIIAGGVAEPILLMFGSAWHC